MHRLQKHLDCVAENVMQHLEAHPECSSDKDHFIRTTDMIMGMNAIYELKEHMAHDHGEWGGTHEAHAVTQDMAKEWVAHMENSDGTHGAHWAIADTTSVAKAHGVTFDHISDWCWWATMNMMYSDYYGDLKGCSVAAVSAAAELPATYVALAKGFLFDEDGKAPAEKLYCYYKYVAKH